MRKHLYLITEHENEDRVGLIAVRDKRFARSKKNESETITVLDEDERGFRDVGQNVYLGYHDFDDEEDYEERFGEVARQKLTEVDQAHVEKAGIDSEVPA